MRVKLGLAAACMVAGTLLSTGAALADFRGERHEVFRGQPHSFGPRCAHRLGAYGEGSSDFFRGGGGIRKAELRAIRHWEEKASLEFGPRFASWQRATGKDLRCDRQGLRVSCQAVAHPCASPLAKGLNAKVGIDGKWGEATNISLSYGVALQDGNGVAHTGQAQIKVPF